MIKEHRQSHEQIHQCDKCDKTYNGVHSDQIYRCDHCEYTSHSKFRTDCHLKRRHTEKKDRIYDFICSKCDRKLFLKYPLLAHMRDIHQESVPVQCLECSRIFRAEKHLAKHTKSMHGDLRKHLCIECGNKFY